MKLSEIHEQEQLDEKALRKAAAAAALAGTLAMPGAMSADKIEQPEPQKAQQKAEKPKDEISAIAKRMKLVWPDELDIPAPNLVQRVELAKKIAKEYRVDTELVQDVVNLAYKYQDKEFPKAEDILAIIGVESSFNPDSKSALKRDPAVGLMQVRPGIWNIEPGDLATIEGQIKHGVDILRKYYRKTGSADDAVQAYNLGITSFRRGNRNPRYVDKYRNFMAANF